uniref:Uncharacterized protein n=1 Tax=Cajanus cajan TaxID=3821 RepID=A0A151SHY1_CAJCA|nr:hypothetical protein KK1_000581 [Cajanus cajan]
MKRALQSKNKFKFVDGSIKNPGPSHHLYDSWVRRNTTVFGWITRTLSQEIAQSIVYFENAQDLWEDLKDRFSKGDYFRISDLLQEIHSIKQGDRSVSAYHTELKTLWEELKALREAPSCTCNVKCSCKFANTAKRNKEVEYVICFLKGLNDQYNTVRSQILMMEPLPSISKAFSHALQQERQLSNPTIQESRVIATTNDIANNWKGNFAGRGGGFAGRGRGKSFGRGNTSNSNKVCTFCGKENHTIDTCYFKHGFPPNFKFKNKNMQSRYKQDT